MPTNNSPRRGPGSTGLVGILRDHVTWCCRAIIAIFLLIYAIAAVDAVLTISVPASRNNPNSIHRLNDLIA